MSKSDKKYINVLLRYFIIQAILILIACVHYYNDSDPTDDTTMSFILLAIIINHFPPIIGSISYIKNIKSRMP